MVGDVLWQLLQFAWLTAASYRLWRIVGADSITQPLRDRIAGNGDAPARAKLHEMIACPWCLGSWVSFGVFAIAAPLYDVWLPVFQALAAAAIVGLIGSRVEE